MFQDMKIISGGQTGVDRAALDFALDKNIKAGGYCPANRKAEDGRIPNRYPLVELESPDYSSRTKANVKASDGTLIFKWQREPGEGTMQTIEFCNKYNKPFQFCEIEKLYNIDEYCSLHQWLVRNQIKVLNVAGNRESENPGIYRKTLEALHLITDL